MTAFIKIQMHKEKPSHSFHRGNTVPEFDPEDRRLNIEQWCAKIDELREVFEWTEEATIYFALTKLKD